MTPTAKALAISLARTVTIAWRLLLTVIIGHVLVCMPPTTAASSLPPNASLTSPTAVPTPSTAAPSTTAPTTPSVFTGPTDVITGGRGDGGGGGGGSATGLNSSEVLIIILCACFAITITLYATARKSADQVSVRPSPYITPLRDVNGVEQQQMHHRPLDMSKHSTTPDLVVTPPQPDQKGKVGNESQAASPGVKVNASESFHGIQDPAFRLWHPSISVDGDTLYLSTGDVSNSCNPGSEEPGARMRHAHIGSFRSGRVYLSPQRSVSPNSEVNIDASQSVPPSRNVVTAHRSPPPELGHETQPAAHGKSDGTTRQQLHRSMSHRLSHSTAGKLKTNLSRRKSFSASSSAFAKIHRGHHEFSTAKPKTDRSTPTKYRTCGTNLAKTHSMGLSTSLRAVRKQHNHPQGVMFPPTVGNGSGRPSVYSYADWRNNDTDPMSLMGSRRS